MSLLRRAAFAAALAAPMALAAAPITLRVEAEAQPNGISNAPSLSADGRTVVFTSVATNLVPTPNAGTLFAYDLRRHALTALTPGRGNMYVPVVSGDGRIVAFESTDTSLTEFPASGFTDVYTLDRTTGTRMQISRGTGGTKPDGGSSAPAISADGRYVGFLSGAKNLVTPALTGNISHLYIADRNTGNIELATRALDGTPANGDASDLDNASFSHDGRRMIFTTRATNLATVFTGNAGDVQVLHRAPGQPRRFENLNRRADGSVGNGSSAYGAISPSGRYATFYSYLRNLQPGIDRFSLYLRDLDAGTLRALPEPIGYNSCTRSRVDDRANVVMRCTSNDGSGRAQLFVLRAGSTTPQLVSGALVGGAGNLSTGAFAMNATGEIVAFASEASNLIPGDTNGVLDVFLRAEPGFIDALFSDGFE